MYLDEQDELRPATDHKSAGVARSAWLGGGAALLVIVVIALFAALGGDAADEGAETVTATPLVAPRSQGQLAAPSTPTPAVAPDPVAPPRATAPTPAAEPTPDAPVVTERTPSPPTAPRHDARRAGPAVAPGPSEEDLLRRLTDRAGAFAAPSRPAPEPAPEPAPRVVAPTPEFAEPPPPPIPVPELSDEPPL